MAKTAEKTTRRNPTTLRVGSCCRVTADQISLAEIFSIRSPLSRRKSGRVSLLLFRLAMMNSNENNTASTQVRARTRESFAPNERVFSESFSVPILREIFNRPPKMFVLLPLQMYRRKRCAPQPIMAQHRCILH